MEIKQKLIPPSMKTTRPGIKMTPKYITVHETSNVSRGANAAAHARLQSNGNSRTASWHFSCDDKDIYQSLPTNEVGWHAGDGRGPGNMTSIGIEICVNSDGNFTKAKENAIWLIKHLMEKHNIPIQNVVPHQKWSGKNCPTNILKSGWTNFVNQIKSQTIQQWDGTSYPRKLGYTDPMTYGEDVKKVQRLVGVTADGYYGKDTNVAVARWKAQNGYGPNANGAIDEVVWYKMFPKPVAPPPIEPVQPTPQPPTDELFVVQTGAFKERKNAEELMERLKKAGFDAIIATKKG